MEFSWSVLQRHGGKQISAVRARMKKLLLQFEAHGHGGADCNARFSPFTLRFASKEPPVNLLVASIYVLVVVNIQVAIVGTTMATTGIINCHNEEPSSIGRV